MTHRAVYLRHTLSARDFNFAQSNNVTGITPPFGANH
jgi:hypothetical protein